MAIETRCPGCQALFKLPEELAGQEVRCQACTRNFVVPQSAQPATEEAPVEATIVEPIADAPEEATPVADAPSTPAETTDAPAPTAAAAVPATPTPKTAKRRPESQGAGVLLALALLAMFVLTLIAVGGFAAVFVAINLTTPTPVVFVPPAVPGRIDFPDRDKDKGFEKDKDKDWWKDKDKDFWNKDKGFMKDKDKGFPPPNGERLPMDFEGKSAFRAGLVNGRREYRVALVAGRRYNFHVQGIGFVPRLEINDALGPIFTRQGPSNSVFFSFVCQNNEDHVIRVGSLDFRNIGDFDLKFSPVMPPPPASVDLSLNPNYTSKYALVIQDPVQPAWPNSPSKEYRMAVVAGSEYEIKIDTLDQKLALRVQGVGPTQSFLANPITQRIDMSYTPNFTGDATLFVNTESHLLSSFTINITRKLATKKEEKPVKVDRPMPTNVEFDGNGKFRKDDVIADNDAQEIMFGRAKTYFIPMEAGHGYNFDMKSPTIDSYMALYDPQGKLVAEDNNSGNRFDARLLFDCKAAGKYKLIASEFKKKTGTYTLEIDRIRLPAGQNVNVPLTVKKQMQDGCDIGEANPPPIFAIANSFAWAPDGKSFVTLDKKGTLHRFRFPELEEDRQLSLPIGAQQIYSSQEGILVANLGTREYWVLDADFLEVKRRLPRLGSTVTMMAPTARSAYTLTTLQDPGGKLSQGLSRHDLTKPKVTFVPNLPEGTIIHGVTPDEQFAFGLDQNSKLVRFRIENRVAKLEETSPRLARIFPGSKQALVFSPDGKMVLHPINNKFPPKDEAQPSPASGYGIAGYRVENLAKPAFVLDTATANAMVATDPKNGLIYVFTSTKGLSVIDRDGKLVRSLAINFGGTSPFVFTVHPDGGKLLALTSSTIKPKLYTITLPADLPVNAVPDKKPPDVPPDREFPKGLGLNPIEDRGMTFRRIQSVSYAPIWRPDGKTFFMSQSSQGLLEVDADDFSIKNKNRELFNAKASYQVGEMSWSAEGLLCVGYDDLVKRMQASHLLVIDPKTLKEKARIPVPYASRVQSAPNLSVAFVGGMENTFGAQSTDFLIVDLKTAKVSKPDVTYRMTPETFQVSPDGKHLYVTDRKTIARFRIDGVAITHEETSQQMKISRGQRMEMSLDGQMVWMSNHPIVNPGTPLRFSTTLLRTKELGKDDQVVNYHNYSIAIDPRDQTMMMTGADRSLLFLDKDLKLKPDQKAPLKMLNTPQLVMNPQGGTLIVHSGAGIFHVRLPDANSPKK